MLIMKYLAKLLKALTSGESPSQLAGGFILGMIIGLLPGKSLLTLVVIILILIINVNVSMAILGFVVFSAFAFFLDPLFHNIGYWLLVNIDALKGMWTSLYNIPVVALTRFNNTVVMGAFLSSLVLLVPVYLLTKVGVVQYREKIHERVLKLKIVQVVKSSKFYSIYENVNSWRD